ncbi:uroporphyrinogen-III synthase [Hydrogenophaga sp. MI9]|uniref:uroporphyrinogen-III synthase n=1 Tax=Hydrogenophaga sp. MI9 TaxID=3453719 RepID=UPI003EEA3F83
MTRPTRWSRVFVTRPRDEGSAWVDALRERGWPALSLPLIDIGAPRDPAALAALAQARVDWPEKDALMFVSAAAVQHFFAERPTAFRHSGSRTRFWSPGPGTARALARALAPLGVAASRIDAPPADAAQFDSEHLWPVVEAQVHPGLRLLVVRGASTSADGEAAGGATGSGREWLLDRCREKGALVERCVAYERHAPRWSDAQRAEALAGTEADSLWLFSSSEAVAHLVAALPAADWSHAQALCTHERIAQAARDAGFGSVFSSRPALDDVLRSLESLQSLP